MRFQKGPIYAADMNGVAVDFFSQLLDEMLFDYTMDTYKPAAFSPGLMCEELFNIVDRVERGEMDRARITPVLEELAYLIGNDGVSKGLIDFEAKFYCEFSEQTKISELISRLRLLRNRLAARPYLLECERLILDYLKDGRDRRKLRLVVRSWAAAKINSGTHPGFIRDAVHQRFFDNPEDFTSLDAVKEFFESVRPAKKQHEIYFWASPLFLHVRDQCRSFRIEVVESKDFPVAVVMPDGDRLVLLKAFGLEAKDQYTARDIAERRIEQISDFFVLFHHREKLAWKKDAFVITEGQLRPIRPTQSPLKKTNDLRPPKASKRFAELVEGLSLRDPDAWSKFMSIVRLHGVAAGAESTQIQLVNLWTALEVIAPHSKSKLRGVVGSIMPFLVCSYIEHIFWDLASDLRRWNGRDFRKIIAEPEYPEGYRLCHKLAEVMICEGRASTREKILILTDGYPLLKFRCLSVIERFGSKSKITSAIELHSKRIEWQIERIYRARNMIVHDGGAPLALDVLTENAHYYLDSFINVVMKLASRGGVARDIDEAITYMKERVLLWNRYLKGQGEIGIGEVDCVISALTLGRK